jgi:hypothetical protein
MEDLCGVVGEPTHTQLEIKLYMKILCVTYAVSYFCDIVNSVSAIAAVYVTLSIVFQQYMRNEK